MAENEGPKFTFTLEQLRAMGVQVDLPGAPASALPAGAPAPQPDYVAQAPAPVAPPAPMPVATAEAAAQAPLAFGAPQVITPSRSGLHSEYTPLYTGIHENLSDKEFPVQGITRTIIKNLPGIGDGITASIDDVVRAALFRAELTDAAGDPLYMEPRLIPPEVLLRTRTAAVNAIRAPGEDNHYQRIVSLTSATEKYMIELISKGEIGLSFWMMRNSATGKKTDAKSLSPYDILMNVEGVTFAGELMYNLYQLGSIHADPNEGMVDTFTRLMGNRYADLEMGYLFGVCVGLPLVADVIADDHPVEYVQEHFVNKVKYLLGMSTEDDPQGNLAKAKAAGQEMILQKYGDAAKKYGEAVHDIEKKIIADANHPLIPFLSRFIDNEASVFKKSSGLATRLIHGACMTQPVQTELMARACLYHAAQNAIYQEYGKR